MSVLDFGAVRPAVIRTHDDGRIEVIEAPPLAVFSMALFAKPDVLAGQTAIQVDEAGNLSLDGQVVYQPVRFMTAVNGLMLICQRIR